MQGKKLRYPFQNYLHGVLHISRQAKREFPLNDKFWKTFKTTTNQRIIHEIDSSDMTKLNKFIFFWKKRKNEKVPAYTFAVDTF